MDQLSMSNTRQQLRKPKRRIVAPHWGTHDHRPVVFIDVGAGEFATVDAEDWPRIKEEYGEVWYRNSNGHGATYARRVMQDPDGRRGVLTLQRAVMQAKQGQRVQLLNGNPLDCRKENLAIMTQAEQQQLMRRHAG